MSDNLKWLLLIPIVIAVIGGGYLVGKLVGSDDDSGSQAVQSNQALELDKADVQQRIDAYQGIVTRTPGDVEALKGLGDSYLELGNLQNENNETNESFASFKSATDFYRKYLAAKPEDAEVRIDLGYAYSLLLMPEVAVRELKAAAQAAPNIADPEARKKAEQRAWHVLGFVLENNLGLNDEATQAWQTAYNIDPNTPMGQEAKQFLDQLTQSQQQPVPTP